MNAPVWHRTLLGVWDAVHTCSVLRGRCFEVCFGHALHGARLYIAINGGKPTHAREIWQWLCLSKRAQP